MEVALSERMVNNNGPQRKLAVMYIIVAVIMLLRGGSDAVFLRAQQATSVGSHHGYYLLTISNKYFQLMEQL